MRGVTSVCLAAVFALIAAGLCPAEPAASVAQPPRHVNVTSDSAPGWTPSPTLEQSARDTALTYLAAKDAGQAAKAYAMVAKRLQGMMPFAAFSDELAKFNVQAGAVVERRITVVTWTKDPAQAPDPGVYAAIDLISRFANVDRHCGYLVLYQPPSGGPFVVSREESNFMDNDSARKIEQTKSAAGVQAAWTELSARCPNYATAVAATAGPLPEETGSTIGYPTVAAALDGLRAQPGVVFSTQHGWTIATNNASATVWSFPPPGDPAYPSAVKRQLVPEGGGEGITTNVLCESTKAACDNLVRSFEQLNAQMKAAIQGH